MRSSSVNRSAPSSRTPPPGRPSLRSASVPRNASPSKAATPRTTKVGPSSVFDLERTISASETNSKTPRSVSQPRGGSVSRGPPTSRGADGLQTSPMRSASQPQPRVPGRLGAVQMSRPMLAPKRAGGMYIPGRKVEKVEAPTQWLKAPATSSVEREKYLAEVAREELKAKEEKRRREREERKRKEAERAERHHARRKEKQKAKKREWKEKQLKKEEEKKAKKDAKIAEKERIAAEAAAALAAEEEEEEEEEESDSDDDADHAEEAAMEKAEAGDFVGDVCVVCAFGLPKVDYWGSCDSYVKPVWNGSGEKVTLNGIKWDLKKNRGRGAEVSIHIDGKELAVRNSQTPRFDFHFQIDFRKADPDAELEIQLWDWDKVGDDDHVSQVVLSSHDVRQRCCTTIANKKQGKFNLKCKPGATGKELKWGVGNLTLQFKLAEQVNYMAEAQKKAFGRTRQQYISQKIQTARKEYQV